MTPWEWIEIGAGGVLLCYAAYDYIGRRIGWSLRSWTARNWPPVEGIIQEGYVRSVAGDGGIRWYALMCCSFQAEGSYYGHEFSIRVKNEAEGLQFVQANHGKTITVRYKPGDPDTARAYMTQAQGKRSSS